MRLSWLLCSVLLMLSVLVGTEAQGTCSCFKRLMKGVRVFDNECADGYLPAVKPRVANCHCQCCNAAGKCGAVSST